MICKIVKNLTSRLKKRRKKMVLSNSTFELKSFIFDTREGFSTDASIKFHRTDELSLDRDAFEVKIPKWEIFTTPQKNLVFIQPGSKINTFSRAQK